MGWDELVSGTLGFRPQVEGRGGSDLLRLIERCAEVVCGPTRLDTTYDSVGL